MGNLITTLTAIPLPLLVQEVIIPYVMHPYRFGGIPFEPPGLFLSVFMNVFFTLIIIGLVATLSGMMTTVRQCKKIQFWTSVYNAKYAMTGGLFGLIILALFPTIKAPLLTIMPRLPFAGVLVTGLYLALFVMIGGMYGNNYNLKDICNTK